MLDDACEPLNEMSAKVMTPIMLAILLGCLAFSANCKGLQLYNHFLIVLYLCLYICIIFQCKMCDINTLAGAEGGYEEMPSPGGRRWQPDGDQMTTRRSSRKMMDVVGGSCVRSTCEGSTCYCCPTVPTTPCFLVLDACLRVCSGSQLSATSLPVSSIVDS